MPRAMIAGVGTTRFGRHPDTHYADLGAQAIEMALQDANMEIADVQYAFCSRVYLPSSSGARTLERLGRLGIPCPDIEGACGSAVAGLEQARMMVESGLYDVVLTFGIDKLPKGFMSPGLIYEDWQSQMGLTQNPQYWAMNAKRHMHDFGTTELQLAMVAAKAKRNGALNPNALFQNPLTVEEILASKPVADPLRLYMICSPDDGAAAAIVCSEEFARRRSPKPVAIAGCAYGISRFPLPNVATFCTTPTNNPSVHAMVAKKAYEQAGLGPEDVDVAEVQDTDAFSEIESYEELGFCARGEGGRLIEEGLTDLGGSIPVNTGGGLQARGEPPGASHYGQIFELVQQLRGDAGPRQVSGAKVGLAHVYGASGHCGVTILAA
jgi:acetyl-CoA C-acetyltransferase